jgi:phosphate transport system protein
MLMLHGVLDAFARMDLDEAICIYRENKKSIRKMKSLCVS